MTDKEQINDFFNADRYGFAGVSANTKKFTHKVFKTLILKDYDMIPVNPKYDDIDGFECFKSIGDLPKSVSSVLIMTPKQATLQTLQECLDNNINNIWLQQGTETEEVTKFVKERNENIITGECILMYAEPVQSIHKLHSFIWKVAGKYAR